MGTSAQTLLLEMLFTSLPMFHHAHVTRVGARVGVGRLRATSGMSGNRYRSGGNRAGTLVIHENDATWGDLALRHLERRWDGAIGKQLFSTSQRQRIDLEPERIDQIMLHQRLQEICTSVHMQIRPRLLLEGADMFRNVSAEKHGGLPFARRHGIRGDVLSR